MGYTRYRGLPLVTVAGTNPYTPPEEPDPVTYATPVIGSIYYSSTFNSTVYEAFAHVKVLVMSGLTTASGATLDAVHEGLEDAAVAVGNTEQRRFPYTNHSDGSTSPTWYGSVSVGGGYDSVQTKIEAMDLWAYKIDGTTRFKSFAPSWFPVPGGTAASYHEGAWSSGATYHYYDRVTYGGTEYMYRQNGTTSSTAPSADPTKWIAGYDNFHNFDINYLVAGSAPVDGSGRYFVDWLGEMYGYVFGSKMSEQPAGLFLDVHMYVGLGRMDWYRDGTRDTSAIKAYDAGATTAQCAAVRSAMRTALKRYRDKLRAELPGIQLLANGDGSAHAAEFYAASDLAGDIDGCMYESAFADSDTNNGTQNNGLAATMATMRQRHAACIDKSLMVVMAKNDVATSYAYIRRCLAACLVSDCTLMVGRTGYTDTPYWYDEFNVDLGTATDAQQTAPHTGNIWKRRFQNGVVLLNSASALDPGPATYMGGAAETVDSSIIPYGIYKRPTGTQDPTHNDGSTVSGSFSLGGWEGLILLCVTPGVHA